MSPTFRVAQDLPAGNVWFCPFSIGKCQAARIRKHWMTTIISFKMLIKKGTLVCLKIRDPVNPRQRLFLILVKNKSNMSFFSVPQNTIDTPILPVIPNTSQYWKWWILWCSSSQVATFPIGIDIITSRRFLLNKSTGLSLKKKKHIDAHLFIIPSGQSPFDTNCVFSSQVLNSTLPSFNKKQLPQVWWLVNQPPLDVPPKKNQGFLRAY